eukprot:g63718.t1
MTSKSETAKVKLSVERSGGLRRIGPYLYGQKLGQGSSGHVFLANHESGSKVALKIIQKKALNEEPNLWGKICSEIALLKLLDHPHILKLIDVLETPRKLYMVLEYVEGGELYECIADGGKLSKNDVLRITAQVVEGLEYCHALHISHRDLKPENLLLDRQRNIKIIDLGLATMSLTGGDEMHTSCGSPQYMSPQVIQGKYIGKEADVWSLGVTVFACATGFLPFDDPIIPKVYEKVCKGEMSIPEETDKDLADLIRKLLCVDPKHRIPLEEIRHHRVFNGTDFFSSVVNPWAGVDAVVSEIKDLGIEDSLLPLDDVLLRELSDLGCWDMTHAELRRDLVQEASYLKGKEMPLHCRVYMLLLIRKRQRAERKSSSSSYRNPSRANSDLGSDLGVGERETRGSGPSRGSLAGTPVRTKSTHKARPLELLPQLAADSHELDLDRQNRLDDVRQKLEGSLQLGHNADAAREIVGVVIRKPADRAGASERGKILLPRSLPVSRAASITLKASNSLSQLHPRPKDTPDTPEEPMSPGLAFVAPLSSTLRLHQAEYSRSAGVSPSLSLRSVVPHTSSSLADLSASPSHSSSSGHPVNFAAYDFTQVQSRTPSRLTSRTNSRAHSPKAPSPRNVNSSLNATLSDEMDFDMAIDGAGGKQQNLSSSMLGGVLLAAGDFTGTRSPDLSHDELLPFPDLEEKAPNHPTLTTTIPDPDFDRPFSKSTSTNAPVWQPRKSGHSIQSVGAAASEEKAENPTLLQSSSNPNLLRSFSQTWTDEKGDKTTALDVLSRGRRHSEDLMSLQVAAMSHQRWHASNLVPVVERGSLSPTPLTTRLLPRPISTASMGHVRSLSVGGIDLSSVSFPETPSPASPPISSEGEDLVTPGSLPLVPEFAQFDQRAKSNGRITPTLSSSDRGVSPASIPPKPANSLFSFSSAHDPASSISEQSKRRLSSKAFTLNSRLQSITSKFRSIELLKPKGPSAAAVRPRANTQPRYDFSEAAHVLHSASPLHSRTNLHTSGTSASSPTSVQTSPILGTRSVSSKSTSLPESPKQSPQQTLSSLPDRGKIRPLHFPSRTNQGPAPARLK